MIQTSSLEEDPLHSVLTTTSVQVGNLIFEYICRLAVRFPPTAGEVANWVEQTVSFFIYVTAANFVSVDREVALENQTDFSALTRSTLTKMRERALRALPRFQQEEESFPPSIIRGNEEFFASEENLFGIVHRMTAIESAFPLLRLLTAAVRSVAPLVVSSESKKHSELIQDFEHATLEVLHVGFHRLCAAVLAIDSYVDEIARTRYNDQRGNETRPSEWVSSLSSHVQGAAALLQSRCQFPSDYLRTTFWQRLVFVVQCALVRGFSRVRKVNDVAIKQMLVDNQAVLNNLQAALKEKYSCVLPDYVAAFLRAGCLEMEAKVTWAKQNSQFYRLHEAAQWLGGNDRERRQTFEGIIVRSGGEDSILVAPFLPKANDAENGASPEGRLSASQSASISESPAPTH